MYTYFLLPETKSLTLEELDAVFSVSNRKHASYYWNKVRSKKYLLSETIEMAD